MTIKTNYTIVSNQTYKGVCEVKKSIWEYSTQEFSNDFQVGVPQDPVLEEVINLKKLPIKVEDICYWNLTPEEVEHQKKYLGGYYNEKGIWIDLLEEKEEENLW
tara:strand:- start:699 stop:1010 length:312 start_codon:yes stop_codon:yes gene_type:complete